MMSLQHTDPDYSCAYVIIQTDAGDGLEGHGPTFTCGRGTEIGTHHFSDFFSPRDKLMYAKCIFT